MLTLLDNLLGRLHLDSNLVVLSPRRCSPSVFESILLPQRMPFKSVVTLAADDDADDAVVLCAAQLGPGQWMANRVRLVAALCTLLCVLTCVCLACNK